VAGEARGGAHIGLDVLGIAAALTAWAVPFYAMSRVAGRDLGPFVAPGGAAYAVGALGLGVVSIGVAVGVRRSAAWLGAALPGLALAAILTREIGFQAAGRVTSAPLDERVKLSLDAVSSACASFAAVALTVAAALVLSAAAFGSRTVRTSPPPLTPAHRAAVWVLGGGAVIATGLYVSSKSASIDLRMIWAAALPACASVGILASARTRADDTDRGRALGEVVLVAALASAAVACVAAAVAARTFVADRAYAPDEALGEAVAHAFRCGRRASLFAIAPWLAAAAHVRPDALAIGWRRAALALVAAILALSPALVAYLAARSARTAAWAATEIAPSLPAGFTLARSRAPSGCDQLVEDRLLVIGRDRVSLGGMDLGAAADAAGCDLELGEGPLWIAVDGSGDFDRARCILGAAAGKLETRPKLEGPSAVDERAPGCEVRWVTSARDGSGALTCSAGFIGAEHCVNAHAKGTADKHLELRVQPSGPLDLRWVTADGTVVVQEEVDRASEDRGGSLFFPALAAAVEASWKANGAHLNELDERSDRAILRVGAGVPAADVVGIEDSLRGITRKVFAQSNVINVTSSPIYLQVFDVGVAALGP